MDAVFLKLIELSIIGSLFVFAVVLLRLIFHKAPKWIFCLLWGIVALRLIVPVSLQSSFSLVPDAVSEKQIASQMVQSYVGDVTYIHEGAENYQAAVEAGRKPIRSGDAFYVVTQKDSLEEPQTVKTAVLPVLSHIWAVGVVLMLGYTLASYLVLRRSVSTATLLEKRIKQSEMIDSPFVLGLIRPVIYLPYGLGDTDRENVVAHEMAHISRKDHWWKPIGFLILSVYWFNPVMWLAYSLLCRDIEGACDEKVIQKLDREGIRAYSTALLNCSVHRRSIAACPLAFGEVGVKARIWRVMHYKKPAFWIVLLMLIASAVAAVLLLTTPPEDVQQQNEPTESMWSTEPMTDMKAILSLVDEIAENPSVAASSNPYDYIKAGQEPFHQILSYGDAAVEYIVSHLRSAQDDGLKEYIMAAACAELTDIGMDKNLEPWFSGKFWLNLYENFLGTPEDTVGASILVDRLLGINRVWMKIVAVEDHPYKQGTHRYSYRFYYGNGEENDTSEQETYLLEIHSCLDHRMGDFDGDGIVELFVHTDAGDMPYELYDRSGTQIVVETFSVVPDMVMNYELLLDTEGYYLYEERWAWFLKDPAAYVAEVAKRPEASLHYICPSGVIPAHMDTARIDAAIAELHVLLDSTPTAYEKKIIYKLLNEIQRSYMPELTETDDVNYERLLEQWCYAAMSTESYHCLQKISNVYDSDPAAFLKGVAVIEKSKLSKDLQPVVSWLVKTNYLYDANAFRSAVKQLAAIAVNEAEKELAERFQKELDAQKEPTMDAEKLLTGESADLWSAFFYDPVKVLRTLGNCEAAQIKPLGQKLWGSPERWAQKLMDKGYGAVNQILTENPTGTQKDAAYKILVYLELEGGYRDTFVPGQPFDYQRLFDKLSYSDGALTSNIMGQLYPVYDADPSRFIRELVQWTEAVPERNLVENIAYDFAYQYAASESYLNHLQELADTMTGDKERDCIRMLIEIYQKVHEKP